MGFSASRGLAKETLKFGQHLPAIFPAKLQKRNCSKGVARYDYASVSVRSLI